MFKRGRYSLLYLYCCFLAFASPIYAQIPYFIGEAGSKWHFPSDHLPVGLSIDHIHIASWNILNKNYLHYIESNTQGLKNSLIMQTHVPLEEKGGLTVREMMILQSIFELIEHKTHPRSLIALEETSEDLLAALREVLPSHFSIMTPFKDEPISQDIFLYDRHIFDFVDLNSVKYEPKCSHSIMTLTLKERSSGKIYRFIQSHVPFSPQHSLSSRMKFAKEVCSQYDPALTIVVMGDMNHLPAIIDRDLKMRAREINLTSPYKSISIAYPTHVDTRQQATWIDNFFVYTPFDDSSISATCDPKELLDGLEAVIEVLQGGGCLAP